LKVPELGVTGENCSEVSIHFSRPFKEKDDTKDEQKNNDDVQPTPETCDEIMNMNYPDLKQRDGRQCCTVTT